MYYNVLYNIYIYIRIYATGSRQIKMAARRKEDLKQATVYLCINGIRFAKDKTPSQT